MRTMSGVIVCALLGSFVLAHAQEKKEAPEPAVYKAEFVIRDGSEAAAKPGRRYAMLIDTGGRGTFRVGQKVPYPTSSYQPSQGTGASPLVSTQYQYVDIGVNIDCRLREVSGKVAINADIDVSTIVQHDKGAAATPPNPAIASIRIGINAMVNPGKSTMVASIDDPVTMRRFDVEATVTKVN